MRIYTITIFSLALLCLIEPSASLKCYICSSIGESGDSCEKAKSDMKSSSCETLNAQFNTCIKLEKDKTVIRTCGTKGMCEPIGSTCSECNEDNCNSSTSVAGSMILTSAAVLFMKYLN